MRQAPIGTGPFKFVEYKANQTIKVARNPNYWKPGLPYLDGIEYTIITNRSTAILAFVSGKFDVTFPYEITVPLVGDVKSQMPAAICDISPMNVAANVLMNPVPPFDDLEVRRDYGLALSQVGNGVDDPDQNYPENYACGSRTYMDYCNKEIDTMIAMQSAERDQEKRKKIAWEIDRKLTQDAVRPMIYYMRGG